MFKFITLASLLLTTSVFAKNSLWLSLDAGKGLSKEASNEDNKANNYLGAKIFLEFTKNNYLLDIGLGFGQYKMITEYSSGNLNSRDFKSSFPNLYISPKILLSPRWILGLDMNYLYQGIRTSQNHEENFFVGPSLAYQIPVSKKIDTRLAMSAMQGAALGSRPMQLAIISLQIGYTIKDDKKQQAVVKMTTQDLNAKNSHFQFDKFDISKKDKSNLIELATILKTTYFEKILIEGHTDRIGSRQYNLELGKKRADSVKNFLAKEDVDENKILVIPMGEENLLDKAYTNEAHAKNRRVEIRIFVNKDDLEKFNNLK